LLSFAFILKIRNVLLVTKGYSLLLENKSYEMRIPKEMVEDWLTFDNLGWWCGAVFAALV